MLPIPALPDHVLLQVFFRDSGLTWRVADDGRWLVTDPGGVEQERPPMSKPERGARRISAAGLSGLRAAVEAVRFASLPAQLTGLSSADVRRPNGRPVELCPMAFTVGAHTVEVQGDPRVPASFGPLEPLYRRLDEEAIGGWAQE